MSPKISSPFKSLERTDRRAFLKTSAMSAIAGGLIAACTKDAAKGAAAAAAAKPTADSDQSGGAMAAHPTVPSPTSAADEMDRMHEAGIKAFPAKTVGLGNQLLEPKIVAGVKVFELTASRVSWETSPGIKVDAFAYNGQVPGPQIRVTEGDRIRVILKNDLPESTAIHFHGFGTSERDGRCPVHYAATPVEAGVSRLRTSSRFRTQARTYVPPRTTTPPNRLAWGCSVHFSLAPKAPSEIERRRYRSCDGAQRRVPRLHVQRQELSRD